MHHTQPVEIFGNVSAPFGTFWPSVDIHGKIYGDRPRKTTLSGGGLNATRVAILDPHIEGYISETVQDRKQVGINH